MLASLEPDRICLSNWQRSLAGLFERIAPTETVTIVDGSRRAFRNVRDALMQVADRAGRTRAATTYLDRFGEAMSTSARDLSNQRQRPLYVGVLHENGSQIFVYGEGSWVHAVLLRLGRANALTTIGRASRR